MKNQTPFKEPKKHGIPGYAFEKYDIKSDHSRQFASKHWHNETEIIYVEKGSIDITINNTYYIGNAGDIFIVNSGELHEIYGTSTPLEYRAFVFDFDMLSFHKDDIAQQTFIEPVLNGKLKFNNTINTSHKAFELLTYINKINTTKSACYILSTKAALMQFFAIMFEENKAVLLKNASPDKKNQLLKGIVKYIDENYNQEISLAEIAAYSNMSRKYFCRFFKNNFNKTFIEYLNDVKIEHSMILLNESNISITDVAISCGFSNMSYFTRTFKKKTGCTPSQYRMHN